MAKNFSYRAKDRTGQLFTGSILADSESAVAAHIREQGYFVTQIKEQKSTDSLASLLNNLRSVNTKEIAVMCRQFATMIDAGLPLLTCLNILVEQCGSSLLKAALQDVYKVVKDGETLSRAMTMHPHVFPSVMVNMVAAGETGGVLDDILNRLAVHFEKEHKLNEKIKSALMYPAVVMVMAVMVVIFIMTFVLPTFIQMFVDMKVDLPLPTRLLLSVSNFLTGHYMVVLGTLFYGSLGLAAALKRRSIRKQMDQLILRLPIAGLLARKVAIARFSRTLSTLIRSGVPIISALDVVGKTIGNLSMEDVLLEAQSNVKEGLGLAQTLGESRIFTPMAVQMIAIGEESGALDRMLEKIADFYESDVDDMVGRLSSIMEPVVIGILGVVIGFIVVAVVLPLFDVISHVGQ